MAKRKTKTDEATKTGPVETAAPPMALKDLPFTRAVAYGIARVGDKESAHALLTDEAGRVYLSEATQRALAQRFAAIDAKLDEVLAELRGAKGGQ